MRSLAALVGLIGLAFGGVANAACEAPFTMDDMLMGLTEVEDHLRNGKDADAGTAAKDMDGKLACMDAPLARMIAARLYRAIGAGTFSSGDTARGMSWLITANEIEPGFVYGLDEISEDHPVRFAFMDASDQSGGDRETVEGDFVDGLVYLDAKKVSSPSARPGRVHLLQHVAEDGTVRGWLIEGAAFPEELIAAPAVAEVDPEEKGKKPKEKAAKEPKEPKEKPAKEPKESSDKEPKAAKEPKTKKTKAPKVKTSEDGTYYSTPQWPAERVILVAGGSAIIAGSVAMYAMSAVSRGKFNDATTLSDVSDYKKTTNGLAVGSAAVGALGVGTLGFGVLFFIVDGQPVTGFQVRF
ncbi:MAG: hypothetical protein HN348_21575 [Proteobacteria bacterium]|jgi:hypothetical protein|nr:hypothetical protein [Pseudomonadota bacterium]